MLVRIFFSSQLTSIAGYINILCRRTIYMEQRYEIPFTSNHSTQRGVSYELLESAEGVLSA